MVDKKPHRAMSQAEAVAHIREGETFFVSVPILVGWKFRDPRRSLTTAV